MILNATIGIILKCFLVVRPIFTLYNQLRKIKLKSDNIRWVSTCRSDFFCSTIDTMARNLMLVNLIIPFFFFYKFDMRFKECLNNLIENLKKKIKQKRQEKKN